MLVSEWFVTIFGGVDDAIELFLPCFDNDFLCPVNGFVESEQTETLKFKLTFTWILNFSDRLLNFHWKIIQSSQQKRKTFSGFQSDTIFNCLLPNRCECVLLVPP